ncbi:MAG: hypothetical protein GWP91_13995, partial [Rhodobacterales bacterium]|nr:hypothetical protein [Rhodobacterales bacterium]
LSQPFIDACQAIQASGELAYQVAEQGDLRLDRVARIPKGVDPTKLTFLQGDATHVPLHLRGADGVLMANLIDRLQDPAECLRNLGGDTSIVRVGGVVVLTSPYTWMRQFTDVEKWLGGFKRDGKRVRTLDVLTEVFASAGFRFLSASDQPLIIREHQRKYELVVAQATVWQRVE